MLRLCCSKLLCQAAFSWLLQQWLGVKQQLLYTEQLSPVSTLHAFSPSQLIPIWLVFMLVLTLLKASIVTSDVKDILGSLQCIYCIASQLHPEKPRVKFLTCPRLPRSEITISTSLFLFFFFLLCMIGQKRHDLREVSLRRRVKRIRWFVAAACCTGVIKIWRWGGTIVDVGVSSERRRRYGEGSRRYI